MTNDKDSSRTSHRSDSGWKHCHSMDESNLNTTICNYCGRVMKGGVLSKRISHDKEGQCC